MSLLRSLRRAIVSSEEQALSARLQAMAAEHGMTARFAFDGMTIVPRQERGPCFASRLGSGPVGEREACTDPRRRLGHDEAARDEVLEVGEHGQARGAV